MKLIKIFIRDTVSRFFQGKKSSYKRHNAEYEEEGKLAVEKATAEKYKREDLFNGPENKFRDLLEMYPNHRDIAIDIGSGAGWLSAELSRYFKDVYAIEPSDAAIIIARKIYTGAAFGNIHWIQGFAEEQLAALMKKIDKPAAFFTGCVFAHLRDEEVLKICAVLRSAPKGSILGFSEPWGIEHHHLMWHVRTQEWWRSVLSGYELDFFGPQIEGVEGRYKGFRGIKVL